ncbi:phosphonopyruvate decarboxylase [Paraburkholderia denitrificans]|uniref:Phosphonopyruvate decarboxylase n=1 Tax=Paraburkholderia denitrificans TaxID=694025 RepID=A0ABW0J750_9BURK
MLLDAELMVDALRAEGIDFFTGVPCSGLTSLINAASNLGDGYYIGATQEGEAAAIAAGAALAGRGTAVLSQNSELGNLVNPLTSMNLPSRIGTLMFITWRGRPGMKDEPQHDVMGRITLDLLCLMGVETQILSLDQTVAHAQISEAASAIRANRVVRALVTPAAVFDDVQLRPSHPKAVRATVSRDVRRGGVLPSRFDAIKSIRRGLPERAAIVATTGKTARELFTLEDREQHFYMVGAMGSASGVGLGIALNWRDPVVVLDGDGAALMHLGTLATIGAHAPGNLIHVVLDNGVHDSTGGQKTVSDAMSFCGVASACGYATATRVDSVDDLAVTVGELCECSGPHLVCVSIRPGSISKLGRPTVTPADVATRFGEFLQCATTEIGTDIALGTA